MKEGEKFERVVLGAIEPLRPKNISISRAGKRCILGKSENRLHPDIVAEKRSLKTSATAKRPLLIIECKDVKSVNGSTYRNQLQRAYAELADLRDLRRCAKYVIVPKKRHRRNSRDFDYDAYFKSIGVKLIEWNGGKKTFLAEIKRRLNPPNRHFGKESKSYQANHYPGREKYKREWVRKHYGIRT
jgi:predicted membrane metal-binding protein